MATDVAREAAYRYVYKRDEGHIDFIDKGVMKAGSRVRKGSIDMTKFLKELRADVSAIKTAKKEEKAAAKA